MRPAAPNSSPRAGRSPRRLGSLALLWALALSPAAAAATTHVYRSVDADGNVVLSDRPPPSGTPVETIELRVPNTFLPPPVNREPPPGAAAAGNSREQAPANPYRSLRVLDPPHEAGIRENAGNVVLTVEVDPTLRPGHELLVYTNGVLRQRASSTQIQLMHLDRGTHVVELQVIDDAGNTLMTSEPSVFHLQRRSVILQPAPRS